VILKSAAGWAICTESEHPIIWKSRKWTRYPKQYFYNVHPNFGSKRKTDSKQTRTQSPLIYSFSHWNMGRRSMPAKPFGTEGEKVMTLRNFLPSFPWRTANSSNPTHKPQRGQGKRRGTSLAIYSSLVSPSPYNDLRHKGSSGYLATTFTMSQLMPCTEKGSSSHPSLLVGDYSFKRGFFLISTESQWR